MFVFAWGIGEGILVYRWIKSGAPPTPGALLLPSAIFLSLAVIAEYQPARAVATAFAYAVDLAVLVQIIGKDPKQQTGWPPPAIPDGQLLPSSSPASPASAAPTVQAT